MSNPCKNSLHGIVIALCYGIKFVVVTSSTSDRKPQKRRTRRVDIVCQLVLTLHFSEVGIRALHQIVWAGN